jgi:hypothetical protein
MEERLVSWKKIYQSKGGRLTLIKSVIQSTYVLLIPLLIASRQGV